MIDICKVQQKEMSKVERRTDRRERERERERERNNAFDQKAKTINSFGK